jgi:predicted nucleic acid-binding protein
LARLTEAIPAGSVVGIDTVAFIYQIEASPTYHRTVQPFFTDLAVGRFLGVTSVVTLLEIAVLPFQRQRPDVVDDYELLLASYPNLQIVAVDRSIARRAAELRAARRFEVADSLQVATALLFGASHFVTNDRVLKHVAGIDILLLDDFLVP